MISPRSKFYLSQYLGLISSILLRLITDTICSDQATSTTLSKSLDNLTRKRVLKKPLIHLSWPPLTWAWEALQGLLDRWRPAPDWEPAASRAAPRVTAGPQEEKSHLLFNLVCFSSLLAILLFCQLKSQDVTQPGVCLPLSTSPSCWRHVLVYISVPPPLNDHRALRNRGNRFSRRKLKPNNPLGRSRIASANAFDLSRRGSCCGCAGIEWE